MDAVLSVTDFLKLATEVLRLNIQSGAFAVEGEVSGYTVKDGKWIIFSLKDEADAASRLKCFATTFKVSGSFEDGMKVRVWGSPSVTKWSELQINVERMEPVGEGALKRAYDLLKSKLEAEGLFDAARKRPIPKFPERIGLITSSDAAAYGDFLRILNNRWGGVRVIHADVRVQGASAVEQILSAFSTLSALPIDQRPEVIVLTRGGGSLEDLHAFNDERVARAVYGSTIPVVVGVGHERDESLCDFVADVRASTPSNAAERVVPDRQQILYSLKMMVERQGDTLHRVIDTGRSVVQTYDRVTGYFMDRQKTKVDGVVQRLLVQSSSWVGGMRQRTDGYERLLRNLDPTRVLSRGYSIVTSGSKVVKDASSLDPGDDITVQFARGSAEARVEKTKN